MQENLKYVLSDFNVPNIGFLLVHASYLAAGMLKQSYRFMSRYGLDWFILSIIGVIIIAAQFPGPGIANGPFSISSIATIGISFIFFFYGLKLNKAKLVAGLSNWKLHVLVQVSTFVLFPLILLAVKPLIKQDDHQLLWMGSFFLAALPSTVSSSVVMVSIAEGNIPAAIFNATISSIAGIFITPLWIEVATGNSSAQMDMSDIMIKLFLQILVPVIVGLLFNPLLGKLAEKYNKQLKYFDQLTILAIVYTAFSESFEQHMFNNINLGELLFLGICMAVLFFIINFLLLYLSRLLHFNREDTITARFCGSKKSLVHGTVMAKVIFINSPVMGILLLPVMVYHALQLIVVSIMARNMAKSHQARR